MDAKSVGSSREGTLHMYGVYFDFELSIPGQLQGFSVGCTLVGTNQHNQSQNGTIAN